MIIVIVIVINPNMDFIGTLQQSRFWLFFFDRCWRGGGEGKMFSRNLGFQGLGV